MRALLTLCLAALCGCGPKEKDAVASAGDAAAVALPDADALLAGALAAAGGAEALERVTTLRTTGTVQMSAQGILAPIVVLQQVPGYVYTRLELPGLGVMEEGVWQGVAWASDPISGPRLKTGVEAAQALRQADLALDAHLAQHYPTRQTVGASTVGGAPVWEVRLVPAEGPEEIALIDQASGRRVGVRLTAASVMGPIPMTMLYTEFREVEGIHFPVRIEQSQGPISTVMQIDDIQINAADFRPAPLPAEIQSLLRASTDPQQ